MYQNYGLKYVNNDACYPSLLVGYMNIVDYDNFGDIKNIFYDLEKRHLIKKENDGIE